MINLMRKRMFTSASCNFCISIPRLKFEVTMFVICSSLVMRQFPIQSLQHPLEIGGNVQQNGKRLQKQIVSMVNAKKTYLIQWPESPGPWLPP